MTGAEVLQAGKQSQTADPNQSQEPQSVFEQKMQLDGLSQPSENTPVAAQQSQIAKARDKDQSEEAQLYAGVWGGVAQTVVKVASTSTSQSDRRRAEELQSELSSLDAKEKKRKRGSYVRDEVTFRALVSVLGPDAATGVHEKIENFVQNTRSPLNASPDAIKQLVKDIAQALSSSEMITRLGVAPSQIEKALEAEITEKLEAEAQKITKGAALHCELLDLTRRAVSANKIEKMLILLEGKESGGIDVATLKERVAQQHISIESRVAELRGNPEIAQLLTQIPDGERIFEEVQAVVADLKRGKTLEIYQSASGEGTLLLIDGAKVPRSLSSGLVHTLLGSQMNFQSTLRSLPGLATGAHNSDAILIALAHGSLTSEEFSFIEALYPVLHPEKRSLESLILEGGIEGKKGRVTEDLTHLRNGESATVISRRILEVLDTKDQNLSRRVPALTNLLYSLTPLEQEAVARRVEKSLNKPLQAPGELYATIIGEVRRQSTGTSDSLHLVEQMGRVLSRGEPISGVVGRDDREIAKESSETLSLLLQEPTANPRFIDELLVHPALSRSERTEKESEELSRRWITLLTGNVQALHSGNTPFPETLATFPTRTPVIDASTIIATSLLKEREVRSQGIESEIAAAQEIIEDVQSEAFRYAQRVGELSGLVGQATSEYDRKNLLAKIEEEHKHFSVSKKEQIAKLEQASEILQKRNGNLEILDGVRRMLEPLKGAQQAIDVAHPLAQIVLQSEGGISDVEISVQIQTLLSSGCSYSEFLNQLSHKYATPEAMTQVSVVLERRFQDGLEVALAYQVGVEAWLKLPEQDRHIKLEAFRLSKEGELIQASIEAARGADRNAFLAAQVKYALYRGTAEAHKELGVILMGSPSGALKGVDRYLQAQGSSLQEITAIRNSGSSLQYGSVSPATIAAWVDAKVSGERVKADAIYLHSVLHAPVGAREGGSATRVIDVAPAISLILRNGFDPSVLPKAQALQAEYQSLYGRSVTSILGEVRGIDERPGVIAGHRSFLTSVLSGNIEATQIAGLASALYIGSNSPASANSSNRMVNVVLLHQIASTMTPEQAKGALVGLERRIQSDSGLASQGIRSVQDLLSSRAKTYPEGPAIEVVTRRVLGIEAQPVTSQELFTVLGSILEAEKIDAITKERARQTAELAKNTKLQEEGALSNLRAAEKEYNQWSFNPFVHVLGVKGDQYTTVQQAKEGYEQLKNSRTKLESAVSEQDRSRVDQLRLRTEAQLALAKGDIATAEKMLQSATALQKESLKGLSRAYDAKSQFFKDENRRIETLRADLNRTIALCDSTESGLRTTRTVVFVTGAVIATGGLGAGFLVTTGALTGIALLSHGTENIGSYVIGEKDIGTAVKDGFWGTVNDAQWIMNGASLGSLYSLVKALPSALRNIYHTVNNNWMLLKDLPGYYKLSFSVLREHGLRTWLASRPVYIMEGPRLISYRLFVEMGKRVQSPFVGASRPLQQFVGDHIPRWVLPQSKGGLWLTLALDLRTAALKAQKSPDDSHVPSKDKDDLNLFGQGGQTPKPATLDPLNPVAAQAPIQPNVQQSITTPPVAGNEPPTNVFEPIYSLIDDIAAGMGGFFTFLTTPPSIVAPTPDGDPPFVPPTIPAIPPTQVNDDKGDKDDPPSAPGPSFDMGSGSGNSYTRYDAGQINEPPAPSFVADSQAKALEAFDTQFGPDPKDPFVTTVPTFPTPKPAPIVHSIPSIDYAYTVTETLLHNHRPQSIHPIWSTKDQNSAIQQSASTYVGNSSQFAQPHVVTDALSAAHNASTLATSHRDAHANGYSNGVQIAMAHGEAHREAHREAHGEDHSQSRQNAAATSQAETLSQLQANINAHAVLSHLSPMKSGAQSAEASAQSEPLRSSDVLRNSVQQALAQSAASSLAQSVAQQQTLSQSSVTLFNAHKASEGLFTNSVAKVATESSRKQGDPSFQEVLMQRGKSTGAQSMDQNPHNSRHVASLEGSKSGAQEDASEYLSYSNPFGSGGLQGGMLDNSHSEGAKHNDPFQVILSKLDVTHEIQEVERLLSIQITTAEDLKRQQRAAIELTEAIRGEFETSRSEQASSERAAELKEKKKAAAKRKFAQDQILRGAVINQLLTQQFTLLEKNKLLSLLIRLGISEAEYRELLVKLGAQGVEALAQEADSRVAYNQNMVESEPIANLTQVNSEERSNSEEQPISTEILSYKSSMLTRAELFERLRKG